MCQDRNISYVSGYAINIPQNYIMHQGILRSHKNAFIINTLRLLHYVSKYVINPTCLFL